MSHLIMKKTLFSKSVVGVNRSEGGLHTFVSASKRPFSKVRYNVAVECDAKSDPVRVISDLRAHGGGSYAVSKTISGKKCIRLSGTFFEVLHFASVIRLAEVLDITLDVSRQLAGFAPRNAELVVFPKPNYDEIMDMKVAKI